jgi:DNA-binding CsgD family transcriptional regulator
VEDELGTSISILEGVASARRVNLAELWLARDPSARLVVARDLSVLMINLKATELLAGAGGLVLREGALTARDRRLATDLANMISQATATPSNRVLLGADGASVLAAAVALDADRAGPVGLSLRDLTAPIHIECAELESMFGVTPGEQQVVVQLLQGRSSREIAEATGKSVLTIRTHVKRAYGKIGVKTRGQLFARLLPYLAIR